MSKQTTIERTAARRAARAIEREQSIAVLAVEQKKAQIRGDSYTENLIMRAIESAQGHTKGENV